MKSDTYKSKVDLWLYVLMFSVFGIFGYDIWRAFEGGKDYLSAFVVFCILIAFSLWFYFDTKYIINDDLLYIRSGPLKHRFDKDKIQRITKSGFWQSSPALSLDRIEIFDGKDRVVISPKNKSKFIESLLKVNASIEVN